MQIDAADRLWVIVCEPPTFFCRKVRQAAYPLRVSWGQQLPRLCVATIPNDPYWVQVREAVYRGVQQCGAELVPLEMVGSLQATKIGRAHV